MKLEHKEVQQQTPVLKAQKYWNQDANMSALLSPESPAFPPLMALSNPVQGVQNGSPQEQTPNASVLRPSSAAAVSLNLRREKAVESLDGVVQGSPAGLKCPIQSGSVADL